MGKKARLRRKTQEQEGTVTYWHGGRAGRAVGDHLIPGTEVISLAGGPDLSQFPWFHDYRPDFVYITTDRDLALDFGIRLSHYSSAALYRVAPVGPREHDPDYPRNVSLRSFRARVLAVEVDPIAKTMPVTHAAHHYMTWEDGAPLYDQDGYALPYKAAQVLGVIPADLRRLGQYAEFDPINRLCSEVMVQRNPDLTREQALRIYQETMPDN